MKYARFYDRPEWKEVRFRVLRRFGAKCHLCGGTKDSGAIIQVDHVKPISIYPELALTEGNLQVLCRDCNLGKSNRSFDDFRPKSLAVERIKRIARDPRELRRIKIRRITDHILKQIAKAEIEKNLVVETKWKRRYLRLQRSMRLRIDDMETA